MEWEKTVRDAALATLAAIGGLFAFMFLMLIVFFPTVMVDVTHNLGMNKACYRYANRVYESRGIVDYIGIAMDSAVLLNMEGEFDEEKIIVCAEKLIADENFNDYCERKDESIGNSTSYKQYVYGTLCVAMYEDGQKTEAVERAFALTEGFPRNNAVFRIAYVAITSLEKDTQTINLIKEKLQKMDESSLNETEKGYYNELLGKIG